MLREESKVKMVGFYDLHVLAGKYKKQSPPLDLALQKLRGTRTNFSPTGVRTEKSLPEVLKVLKYTKGHK